MPPPSPPHTQAPPPLTVLSHTVSHRAPPLHSTSKQQTTTRREKVNEDGWMNVPLPALAPLPFNPPDCFPHAPSLLPPSAHSWVCSLVLWLWPVCITHISVSTDPPSGCPYKGLSFPKVRSEPCTQVLSRHLVWKNKNSLLASTVSVVGTTPEAAMASEVNVIPQI